MGKPAGLCALSGISLAPAHRGTSETAVKFRDKRAEGRIGKIFSGRQSPLCRLAGILSEADTGFLG